VSQTLEQLIPLIGYFAGVVDVGDSRKWRTIPCIKVSFEE
jgi:hypothetical protein